MQRYSGRPASSTTVLTALEFARQPSANQRWPFSSPTGTGMSGWVFREILGRLLAFPSFSRCLACM
ncbi:hypothetical protein FQN58_10020 [Bacteroides xylanisolvens]|uniref:Uncharacterized protein n=1 Tax=Bacteroides ovatus TaxID=28116 RepID=A0AAP9DHR3_BACOV|nr:hypothetical protein IB64_007130 [Bacteroides fragilis]QDM08711.1 hypothetical protein DYI28_08205 [Bacteroides ovatus]QUR43531.1 hypothetical protein FQN58_10020 [Bacteroides xylanisolvens]RHI69379.1 hypothetical protein DW158_19350 [Parabacteroides merdae]